jgi:mono/diheme cytochrome c family protein
MRRLLPYLLLVAGCSGPEAPDDPTWADVQPLLASHCVRCHGSPAINGAPDGFRLDVYGDTVADGGRTVRGASTVAEFIRRRTNPDEQLDGDGNLKYPLMPPIVGLEDWQIETLRRWKPVPPAEDPFAGFGERPPRGDRPGNHTPLLRLQRALADSIDGDDLTVEYQITDDDHDMVRGELTANGSTIGELHSGRGTVVWDIGAAAPDDYRLEAHLDDGGGASLVDRDLGSVRIDHADTAPTALILAPGPYALLHPDDADDPIVIQVFDADGDDILVTVSAVRGAEQVPIVQCSPPTDLGGCALPGDLVTPAWNDFGGATEGGGWRLEVTTSDGVKSRTIRSATPFRISRASTTLHFADVADAFGKCTDCHPAQLLDGRVRIPDMGQDFNAWADNPDNGFAGVHTMRGPIYRRAIEQHTMPPPSDGQRLTDQELADIADWLLGGAPE